MHNLNNDNYISKPSMTQSCIIRAKQPTLAILPSQKHCVLFVALSCSTVWHSRIIKTMRFQTSTISLQLCADLLISHSVVRGHCIRTTRWTSVLSDPSACQLTMNTLSHVSGITRSVKHLRDSRHAVAFFSGSYPRLSTVLHTGWTCLALSLCPAVSNFPVLVWFVVECIGSLVERMMTPLR